MTKEIKNYDMWSIKDIYCLLLLKQALSDLEIKNHLYLQIL